MKYRRFGRTNLQIPVFSCGGMRYQHKWQDVPPEEIPAANQLNLEACIRKSVELGINHIETARGYGSSEMQLGEVLPKFPREQLIVQTKVAPAKDPKTFLETFDKSMAYLKLDHVDLFSLHGINDAETLAWSLAPGGCLEAAQKLQKQGRVRHIGFSTHGLNRHIVEAIRSNGFDYVNLHWYFVNNLNWQAVEEATQRDMGVFIISPNDKGGKLYEPPQKLVDLCAPLSPMAFNNLFCFARPQVHTLSLGAAKPSDFDEHIRSLEYYDTAAETVAPIVKRLEAEIERVIGADFYRNWTQGLPEWLDVPGHINIQEIVRLWIYAKSLDLVSWGKMRYNLLGNAGHWFPGENALRLTEFDLRPCLEQSPYRDRVLEILKEAHTLLYDKPVERLSKSD